MTHLYRLARLAVRLRAVSALAVVLAFAGCNSDSLTTPPYDSTPTVTNGASSGPSFATVFRGGIPFGNFHQPTSTLGDRYNGAMRNITPDNLLSELKAIKERGAKVMLNFAGAPARYTDGSGHFSLTMWKTSTDRFKGIDLSSYIQDGTVIGNFLLDEPNDPDNWNGIAVSASTVEEMARYSKSRWPSLPTVIRARPSYFTGTLQYLDAAWAQYHSKFGDPARFIAENVAQAKSRGLALVVGFNILKGNYGSELTASQIESWGSDLLASDYPCAFLSWEYHETYMERSTIAQALGYLSGKAGNRASKSCRGTAGQTSGSVPEPSDPPPAPAPVTNGAFNLTVGAIWSDNGRQYVRLVWSGGRTATLDVYRDGVFRKNVENDGRQTFIRPLGGSSTYSFKLCEKSSTTCSNAVTARF